MKNIKTWKILLASALAISGFCLFLFYILRPINIIGVPSNGLIFSGMGVLMYHDLVNSHKIGKKKESNDSYTLSFAYYFLPAVASSIIIVGLLMGVTSSVLFIFEIITSPNRNPKYIGLIAACFALIMGYALFLFRLKARFFYGVSELLVGLLVAYTQIQSLQKEDQIFHPAFAIPLFTASVYLIVRAFDNMHQGRDSDMAIIFIKKIFPIRSK